MDDVDQGLEQDKPARRQANARADHHAVVTALGQTALHGGHGGLVGIDKAVLRLQPRPAMSASATLTPAWIFSALMPGGRAGSEKSTVAGSKPTNITRFIASSAKLRSYAASTRPIARQAAR